jgi:NlpC/P60 family putative phage cell wall peptidase
MAPIERERVVAIARTWIGTPYHHQASLLGVGCDCIGLVRGVMRELYGKEPQDLPPYPRDWGDSNGSEDIIEAGRRHLIEVPLVDMGPGDVIAVRWRAHLVAKHTMIVSFGGRAIHAYNKAPVSEIHLSDWWRARIAVVFKLPGVE